MSGAQITKQEEVTRLLGTARASGFLGKYGLWLAAAVLIALGALAYILLREGGKTQTPRYQTEEVTRGTLVVTVSATGNL